MYSSPKTILLGAALAAASPIAYYNTTLTERSTVSFPPNSTNGTAPINSTHRVDLSPESKKCEFERFFLAYCQFFGDDKGSHVCLDEQVNYKLCLKREEPEDLIQKIFGDPKNATVSARAPTNGTAPTNSTHWVDLIPEPKKCWIEHFILHNCKVYGGPHEECVVEQANYSACLKREEMQDLIRKLFGKPKNATVSARASTDGIVPPPPGPKKGTLGYELSKCNPEGYRRCLRKGGEDCDAELDKFSECRVKDLAKEILRPRPKLPEEVYAIGHDGLVIVGKDDPDIPKDPPFFPHIPKGGIVLPNGDIFVDGEIVGNIFDKKKGGDA